MKHLKSNRLSHLAHGETFPTPAQVKARAELERQQAARTSARWCSLCGTQHAIAKGEPNPWPHITRPQIEALPALLEALADLLEWGEQTGGWEAPCWNKARAAIALAKGGSI